MIADFKKFGLEKIDSFRLLYYFPDLDAREFMKYWKEKYDQVHKLIFSVNTFGEEFDKINFLNYDSNKIFMEVAEKVL